MTLKPFMMAVCSLLLFANLPAFAEKTQASPKAKQDEAPVVQQHPEDKAVSSKPTTKDPEPAPKQPSGQPKGKAISNNPKASESASDGKVEPTTSEADAKCTEEKNQKEIVGYRTIQARGRQHREPIYGNRKR